MEMDRLASLIKDAETLRRRLWASMPWSLKLSAILTVLAEGSQDAFNRTFAAMFLVAGVQEMPDIKGVHFKAPDGTQQEYPHRSSEFSQKFLEVNGHKSWHDQVRQLSGLLPRGYAGKIGGAAFKEAVAITRSRMAAEDILVQLIDNFYSKSYGQQIKPVHFNQAIGLVVLSAKRLALNEIAHRKVLNEVGMGDEGEEGAPIVKAPEPTSLEEMSRHYVRRMLEELKEPEVRQKLELAHPDALAFIELSAQGYDDKEIVGDSLRGIPTMLPHVKKEIERGGKGMGYQNWQAHIKPKIFKILREHLGDSPV